MRRQLQAAMSALQARQQQKGWQQLAAGQQRALHANLSVGAGVEHGVSIKRHSEPGHRDLSQRELGCARRNGIVWGELDAGVWLRACKAQHATDGHGRTQQQQQQQQGSPGDVVSPDSDSDSQQLGLPGCDAAEWGVARYVLHEYAEAVAVGEDGEVLLDPDPQLPVLQLSAAGVVTQQPAGSKGEGACSLLEGPVSALDRLQLEVIPAARAWVLAHVEHLPGLKS